MKEVIKKFGCEGFPGDGVSTWEISCGQNIPKVQLYKQYLLANILRAEYHQSTIVRAISSGQ